MNATLCKNNTTNATTALNEARCETQRGVEWCLQNLPPNFVVKIVQSSLSTKKRGTLAAQSLLSLSYLKLNSFAKSARLRTTSSSSSSSTTATHFHDVLPFAHHRFEKRRAV
jgi:hypothetical protein